MKFDIVSRFEFNCLRFLLALAWMLHGVFADAQGNDSFTLLHADRASIGTKTLVPMDLLRNGDQVHVSGLTVLVHRTGKFIEITRDSVLNIGKMDAAILSSLRMDSCLNEWPDLDRFFSSKFQNRRSAAVTAGMPGIEMLFGPNIKANPKQQVLLWWKPNGDNETDTYRLTFKNIFDEALSNPFVTHEQRLLVTLDTFQLEADYPVLVVHVRDSDDRNWRDAETGIRLSATSYFMPDNFDPNTAMNALEIAFYLEEQGEMKLAQPYYQLAADLSNHSFYQSMLENFKKRLEDR